MVVNEDIKALAKQAYELAHLPEPERAARKWEAVSVCGQILSAATPAGPRRRPGGARGPLGRQDPGPGPRRARRSVVVPCGPTMASRR
jgi:hypothetical protein